MHGQPLVTCLSSGVAAMATPPLCDLYLQMSPGCCRIVPPRAQASRGPCHGRAVCLVGVGLACAWAPCAVVRPSSPLLCPTTVWCGYHCLEALGDM